MIDTIRLRILLVALSGWVNRHQHDVIDYLRQENRVLKEHLRGRRLRLTDAQRRRLAATGHRLGRRTLTDVATLVTPDTQVSAAPGGRTSASIFLAGGFGFTDAVRLLRII